MATGSQSRLCSGSAACEVGLDGHFCRDRAGVGHHFPRTGLYESGYHCHPIACSRWGEQEGVKEKYSQLKKTLAALLSLNSDSALPSASLDKLRSRVSNNRPQR